MANIKTKRKSEVTVRHSPLLEAGLSSQFAGFLQQSSEGYLNTRQEDV